MPVLNHWILGFYYKIIERECKKRCRKNEYENDFYTLINHIDTQCLLGTNSKIDIEYFSELLGIDKSFIKDDLDRDKLLIYEKGLAPILADKYYFFQNEDWVKILDNK